MAQYISKSAIVAEIKTRIETYNKGYANGDDCRADALETFLHDIDFLEVKEVDLEKEFDSFLNDIEGMPPMWHSEEQIEWGKDIARHFFELGLKAQKGE